jgi:hypothetical protein
MQGNLGRREYLRYGCYIIYSRAKAYFVTPVRLAGGGGIDLYGGG